MPSCLPRRGYRALPTKPSRYELPGIASSDGCGQASVQGLDIARGFACGVDANRAKVRPHSRVGSPFQGVRHRITWIRLGSRG